MVKNSKYIKKIVNQEEYKNGTKLTTLRITKKKDEIITMDEIEQLQFELEEKTAYYNVCIRGLNDRWTTIKGFDQQWNDNTYLDYYDNKVKDDAKFSEFFQLEVYIYKNV